MKTRSIFRLVDEKPDSGVIKIDYWFLFSYITLMILGYFSVKSAILNSTMYDGYDVKQLMWIAIGILVYIITFFLPERVIKTITPWLFFIFMSTLVIVLFLPPVKGSHRWIRIGPGFQPSEFFKAAVLLYLSLILSEKKNRSYYIISGFVFVSAVLIYKEPDLGAAFVTVMIWLILTFSSGRFEKVWKWVLGLGLSMLPFVLLVMKDYQRNRLIGFLFPQENAQDIAYNALQSMRAIGSGGLLGKGYMNGYMNLGNFVPEHHTDFIISVIGEEFGFLGILFVILLYSIIIWRLIVGIKNGKDSYWKLIMTGVGFWLFFNVFENIGMNIGIMPVKGVPLPLISYGGSPTMVYSFILGLASKGCSQSKNYNR